MSGVPSVHHMKWRLRNRGYLKAPFIDKYKVFVTDIVHEIACKYVVSSITLAFRDLESNIYILFGKYSAF